MSATPLIHVFTTCTAEQAEPLRRALEGRSYMNFQVAICPAGGEFRVYVGTRRPDTTEEELRELVLYVLCGDIVLGPPPWAGEPDVSERHGDDCRCYDCTCCSGWRPE
jgi:hypothetical protein